VININSSSTGNTLRNNVLFDLNPSSLVGAITITSDSLSGFVSDDNLVDPRFLVDGTNETLSQWQAATGNDTHSAPTTYAAGALTVGYSGDSTFGGTIQNITGPLALDKIGAGSLLLSGTNTYSGGTTVSDGTLDVTNSDALPAGSSLTVGAGGTLVFDSTAATSPTRAVPEPGTLALLTVAAFATAICRCIQSRRKKPNGPPSRPLLLALRRPHSQPCRRSSSAPGSEAGLKATPILGTQKKPACAGSSFPIELRRKWLIQKRGGQSLS